MRLDWAAGRGMLEAGGRMLEWAAWGPPPATAPVIVMLHEGLGCLALWRDFPARLQAATGLPVLAYSRAGYGWSEPVPLPRPLDFMTREAVAVLLAVLAALRAPSHVLLGHSDGATIAAEYAGRVADPGLAGLILMAPHFFTEPMGLAEIARAGEAFRTTELRSRMAKYHRDPDVAFRGWNDVWLDPGFAAWNVAGVLDQIAVPTLVIQGWQDQYGTVAQVREVERRSPAPVEVLMLDDCRHAPQFDQLEAVLAAIAGLTQRLGRCAATAAEAR